MKIEVGKYYRTENGDKARIYATDGELNRQIHGAVLQPDGRWVLMCWASDGKCTHNPFLDLIAEWTEPLDFDPSCLPAWANWIVMIENGSWFWHQSQPDMYTEGYWVGGSIDTKGYIPQQYAPKNFTGDWKDSLYNVSDLKN